MLTEVESHLAMLFLSEESSCRNPAPAKVSMRRAEIQAQLRKKSARDRRDCLHVQAGTTCVLSSIPQTASSRNDTHDVTKVTLEIASVKKE